ncbi:MAG: acylphosphatase [Methanothrix sp.]|nr:acylphosphatase [Methanothrix sp.]
MHKLTAFISGKVQMAGYRSKVVTIARAFGLKGYVRNMQDGRVKILAEGPLDDLERFLKAIKIENTLIKVDDIQSEFSDALGAYDDFFKVAGENETDARLDVAAGHLKELIVVVKDGFKETVSKLGGMDGSLKEISQKQDEMIVEMRGGFKELAGKQDEMIAETRGGFKELAGKQDEMIAETRGGFKELSGKQDVMIAETRGGFKELSGKQDEMIAETRDGFKENNALLQEFSAKQDYVIDAIDEARADVVSEVQGLRSDLKGRMDERLQRIESDVVEIKARMRPG